MQSFIGLNSFTAYGSSDGLPRQPGQTVTLLPGFSNQFTLSSWSFVFDATYSNIWFGISQPTAGAIFQYTKSGTGQWVQNTTNSVTLDSSSAFYSIAGRYESGALVIYAAQAAHLYSYNTVTKVKTLLQTAATNMAFRGVAFPPSGALPVTPTGSLTPSTTPSNTATPTKTPTSSITSSQTPTASLTTTPSSSDTSTSTSSASDTSSSTSTSTASSTATSSASLSAGASASATASGSWTASQTSTSTSSASNTATPTCTASNTATPTMSPLSPNPNMARINTIGTGQCLNLIELMVFDINNRDVSASAAGAVLSATSTYQVNVNNAPMYGGDLQCDPATQVLSQQFYNAACNTTSDYYQATFPAAPGYPGGLPVLISNVYFINRIDSTFATRIVNSHGQLQLFSPNGSMVAQRNFTSSATVSSFTFNTPLNASTPSLSDPIQSNPVAQSSYARYIRVNAAPNKCLAFREIFVMDKTYMNVALNKPTTSSAQFGTSTAAMGVNGVIDFDNAAAGDMTNSSACDGSAFWQVDLGGIYNLSTIIVFNRFHLTSPTTTGQALGARLSGAQMLILNAFGAAIGNITLNGSMIQTYFVSSEWPG